ncbi:hypothetical protein [Kineosporia sp. NBRC 101731]|uniref:hypothetical protein n=1 Tax=Kineosporia sp. NBRC 101731 TaxID=3032199 RepID=UPI00249FB0D1|nr:hypothetical protein [Kineosporia sp. NBRC 101731]GLY29695.1 hypothetical protein Kisp02_30600 [Kineosporia sp. NBRC 101731]
MTHPPSPRSPKVDFARKKSDKKYSLISGGEVWMGLNPVGPAKDSNYQIVTARDSEGGNVDCLSMNSAGQISEESCEEVEKPGEIIIGRDVFHFEKRGKEWDIQAFRGYLEAHGRQAGRTKDWNTKTAQGFTVVYAPVG